MQSEELIKDLKDNISIIIEKYRGMDMSSLYESFDINKNAKNSLNSLIMRMIAENDPSHLCLNSNSELVGIKTVKLDKYKNLKESMSFRTFRYYDIANEDWGGSSLRKEFVNKHYIFVTFVDDGTKLLLKRMQIWKMPTNVLDIGARTVWERTRECVITGHIVKYIDDYGRYKTYFPSSTENPYMHVRPHAKNKNDTFPLPVPDKLTGLIEYPKHSFWLNRSYILKIVSEE